MRFNLFAWLVWTTPMQMNAKIYIYYYPVKINQVDQFMSAEENSLRPYYWIWLHALFKHYRF